MEDFFLFVICRCVEYIFNGEGFVIFRNSVEYYWIFVGDVSFDFEEVYGMWLVVFDDVVLEDDLVYGEDLDNSIEFFVFSIFKYKKVND